MHLREHYAKAALYEGIVLPFMHFCEILSLLLDTAGSPSLGSISLETIASKIAIEKYYCSLFLVACGIAIGMPTPIWNCDRKSEAICLSVAYIYLSCSMPSNLRNFSPSISAKANELPFGPSTVRNARPQ